MTRDRTATLERRDVQGAALVDGRVARNGSYGRMRRAAQQLLVSKGEREEAELERRIRTLPGVTRPNVVALLSPKGGVGKTTCTFIVGNLLATHLKTRAIAVDANPDFGTLGRLPSDARRCQRTLDELLADAEQLKTAAQLNAYVSRQPSGLHVLAAPSDPEATAALVPDRYGELVALLSCFYEVVLLDLGTGVGGPLARFAIDRADQAVLVSTPEWVTSSVVLDALGAHAPRPHDGRAEQVDAARDGPAGRRAALSRRAASSHGDDPLRRAAGHDARRRPLHPRRAAAPDATGDQAAWARRRRAAGVMRAAREQPRVVDRQGARGRCACWPSASRSVPRSPATTATRRARRRCASTPPSRPSHERAAELQRSRTEVRGAVAARARAKRALARLRRENRGLRRDLLVTTLRAAPRTQQTLSAAIETEPIMFFRVLAAMVTADAIDRNRRRQHERAWIAAQQRPQHQRSHATP